MTFESAIELHPTGLIAATTPTTPTQYVTWDLGAGTPRVVPAGTLLQVVVSAIVTAAAPLEATPRALDNDNLAKFRYNRHLRAQRLTARRRHRPRHPAPPIGISKGIQSINHRDRRRGRPRQRRRQHSPRQRPGHLPPSTCTTSPQPAPSTAPHRRTRRLGHPPHRHHLLGHHHDQQPGLLLRPDTPCRPNLASGDTTSSIIRWQLDSSISLAPQAYSRLTYTMTVPPDASVSTRLTNTAAVVSFTTSTNTPTAPAAIHHPRRQHQRRHHPRQRRRPRSRRHLMGRAARQPS